MDIEHSPLMERLGIFWVRVHDIGGFLDPDELTLEDEPNYEVLDAIRLIGVLLGGESYIAANTQRRRDLVKDTEWLQRHRVYELSGFTYFPGSFIECDGPERKDPAMDNVLSQYGWGHVQVAVFDNRLDVMRSFSPDTHCFGYQVKDADTPASRAWLATKPPNLHLVNTPRQLAQSVIHVHMAVLWRLADKALRQSPAFDAEIKRLKMIFKRYPR